LFLLLLLSPPFILIATTSNTVRNIGRTFTGYYTATATTTTTTTIIIIAGHSQDRSGANARRILPQHPQHFRRIGAVDNARHAGLHDARLVPRHLLDRVAEVRAVVEPNLGDDRRQNPRALVFCCRFT
jgi:hypothetical protein